MAMRALLQPSRRRDGVQRRQLQRPAQPAPLAPPLLPHARVVAVHAGAATAQPDAHDALAALLERVLSQHLRAALSTALCAMFPGSAAG
jgi:hypothetical protein